jgi:hypothetical protein
MPTALEERPANPLYVGVAAFRQKHDVQVRLGVENRRDIAKNSEQLSLD